jgi:signal transduction histidine kinase
MSAPRHDVRNKLTTVRNGVFFIRQKLKGQPVLTQEPRIEQFFQMIDRELDDLGAKLSTRLPPPEEVQPGEAGLSELRSAVLGPLHWAPGCEVWGPEGPEVRVKGNAGELGLALFCLLENAADAVAGASRRAIRIEVRRQDAEARLTVSDSGPGFVDAHTALMPFYSSRPGRAGLGLKIAQRVAHRWGGRLELGSSDLGGARAALLLQPA